LEVSGVGLAVVKRKSVRQVTHYWVQGSSHQNSRDYQLPFHCSLYIVHSDFREVSSEEGGNKAD
jgi:hypothetical protein